MKVNLTNTEKCDFDGCERTDTTPCVYIVMKRDQSVFQALYRYGLVRTWQLWRDGSVEVLDGYYCAVHAYEKGFCWGCGHFCAGMERFDFQVGGQWMCDGCWSNFESEFDDEDRDWLDCDEDSGWLP